MLVSISSANCRSYLPPSFGQGQGFGGSFGGGNNGSRRPFTNGGFGAHSGLSSSSSSGFGGAPRRGIERFISSGMLFSSFRRIQQRNEPPKQWILLEWRLPSSNRSLAGTKCLSWFRVIFQQTEIRNSHYVSFSVSSKI